MPVQYFLTRAVCNVYFHPLAGFKGPFLWWASRIPFINSMLAGELPYRVKGLHDKYGSVVRVAPDKLSYQSQSWLTFNLHCPHLMKRSKSVCPTSQIVLILYYTSLPITKHPRTQVCPREKSRPTLWLSLSPGVKP